VTQSLYALNQTLENTGTGKNQSFQLWVWMPVV